MDVLSVATTVFSLCRAINTWVEQLQQREDVINEISHLVVQIRDILEPFTSFSSSSPSGPASLAMQGAGTGELQLSQSIRSLGDALEKTQEHLIVWKYKTTQSSSQKLISLLNPGSLIKQLEDDEKRLSRQMSVLLASLAVVGYFHDKSMIGMSTGGAGIGAGAGGWGSVNGKKNSASPGAVSFPVPSPVTAPPMIKATTSSGSTSSGHKVLDALNTIKNKRAVKFWTSEFGGADFVHEDTFIARLSVWYSSVESNGGTPSTLPPKAGRLILMRMDEYNIGGVTVDNFASALGKENLRAFVRRYINGRPKIPESPSAGGSNSSSLKMALKTPLLVWVDDEPKNNRSKVPKAQEMGITVIQLTSTAVAKAWIEDNAAFLQKHDTASQIRFITDYARFEVDNTTQQKYLNRSAGQDLLRYLRGRLYKAPVLVYTNFSKKGKGPTKYVEGYDLAGVSSKSDVLLAYCRALADGRTDDEAWRGWKEENFRD
ncbi:hypothetical protein D9613_006510 [Agrocybe pediades]|uniref:Uncharacterized protein n=1 Tax=Agrocybe pediades TaxID=84607 RepID=A0A8H4VIB0_9AGAR|nr:hypothetical protein D9613_006510 [Agrocybe pediades]